jgi:hypothetical protein
MRFNLSLTLRQQAWIASVTFTVIGILCLIYLPGIFDRDLETGAAIIGLRLLGGTFLGLGGLGLVWVLGDLYLKFTRSDRREKWFWWGNFLLGILGALTYAIPATFIFPLFVFAYLNRPNLFFPAGGNANEILMLGAIFSVTGGLTLWAAYLPAREKYKQRP